VRAVPQGRHVGLGLDCLILLDPIVFSRQWVAAWNAHDVEAVLEHFHDDVVFTSPVAARLLPDTHGVVRGKQALRHYWTVALARVPNLRFTVDGVYQGVDTVVIAYRNQDEGLVSEVLRFRDGLVIEGHGTYRS
jgi:ketosteroid isomerase-like protein